MYRVYLFKRGVNSFKPAATLLFLLLGLMAGCGPRDVRYRPKELQLGGFLAPREVVTGRRAHGLYLMKASDERSLLCCWVAPDASMFVSKRLRNTKLVVNIFVPDLPPFLNDPQALSVGFGEGDLFVKKIDGLKPGFHMIEIALPPGIQESRGAIDVRLKAHYGFVPPGAGADPPHYAFILTSIYFE